MELSLLAYIRFYQLQVTLMNFLEVFALFGVFEQLKGLLGGVDNSV